MNDQYVIPGADDSQVPPGYRYLSKDETIVESDRRWESPDENPGMDEAGMPAGWIEVPSLDIGGTPAIHGDKYIRKDKYVLFYVYGDEDDKRLIIHNPPENLRAMLDEWKALDAVLSETGHEPSDWQPVNIWLKAKGVDIIEPSEIVEL